MTSKSSPKKKCGVKSDKPQIQHVDYSKYKSEPILLMDRDPDSGRSTAERHRCSDVYYAGYSLNHEKRVVDKDLVLIPNAKLWEAVADMADWDAVDLFPCVTGTIFAHEAVGAPLGEEIFFVDDNANYVWRFPVPEEAKGLVDVLLIAEPPHYQLSMRGRELVVKPESVTILGNFHPKMEALEETLEEDRRLFGSRDEEVTHSRIKRACWGYCEMSEVTKPQHIPTSDSLFSDESLEFAEDPVVYFQRSGKARVGSVVCDLNKNIELDTMVPEIYLEIPHSHITNQVYGNYKIVAVEIK
jgi:hypothetical protein